MKRIYLDYAAATPLDPAVLKAMQPYFSERFYNPSATYLAAKAVAQDIEAARRLVAHWLGSRPAEIVFTAGGTEANNLALRGVMEAFPGKQLLISAIEHESVLAPAEHYGANRIPVKPDGQIDIDGLNKLITDKTVLISVMYANNEIGTIEPVREIAKLIKAVRKDRQRRSIELPLYLHTDGCQAAAYLDLHVDRLGVDLMTINAGKIYGPKQAGALYVKTGVWLAPQILGGGQERGMRSGTESAANIVGFAAALEMVQARRSDEAARLMKLRDGFKSLLEAAIPQLVVNGSMKHRLPNNLHITIPGQDNERLLMALDEQGIICASGSACSASKEEASHVLTALGKTDAEAYAALRFSLGQGTTAVELQKVVAALRQLIS